MGTWPLGYLAREQLLERLARRPASVEALLTHMQYPGSPGSIRFLSMDEKLAKLLLQAAHLKKELPEYRRLSTDDILVCECYDAITDDKNRVPIEHCVTLFGPVDEDEISLPFGRFFYKQGYSIFIEVPIGKSRADLVAYKPDRLIAVELKTRTDQLKKCFAQLMDYQTGADQVYLGTVPGTIVDYLRADIDEINPRMLEEELSKFGAGLIVFDHDTDQCEIVMEPGAGRPRKDTRDWLMRQCEDILKQVVPMFQWTDRPM